jgi:hypothetical protein
MKQLGRWRIVPRLPAGDRRLRHSNSAGEFGLGGTSAFSQGAQHRADIDGTEGGVGQDDVGVPDIGKAQEAGLSSVIGFVSFQ